MSTFLSPSASHREQVHRRAIVLAIGALIIFSTLPVFGHHLAGRAEAMLVGRDHLGAFCLVALHMLLAPVHGVFHLLLIAGLGYASWTRVRASHRLRELLRLLPSYPALPGSSFEVAAERAGLPPACLRVVAGLPVPAFTSGWLRPVVYADAALADRMAADELAALLAHEAAHVERRDPLRLSLLRFLAQVLFWVPALRRIADDAADEMEVAADDYAARRAATFSGGAGNRGPLVLASAILALADARTSYGRGMSSDAAVIGGVGFHRQDLLERRVRRLAGEDVAFGTHLTRRSVTGACAALAAVWISGLMMAHPLPAADSVLEHCEHHHDFALMHLFCRGEVSDRPCPHMGL
ncbi:MAG: M48 family metalloprotease [Gemmatimonadota bacterium]|nr:M48 family metalloprotease [Gemmatimonadota bacterium]